MKKYIIIPGCSDLNRGDQALVWETKRLAEEAGYRGEFYLTSEKNEPVEQSKSKGLKIISPILEHPSRKFKNKENLNYTISLKMKWGIISFFDFIGSMFILWKPTREIAKYFMDEGKKHTIETMEQAGALFMKGGGLLQTYGGFSSTYSMYFWVYPILFAHCLKKPVFVMPNSFGPFEGPLVKNVARLALKRCKILTSRESFSENMVREQLQVDIKNYPDLAFMLPFSELDKRTVFDIYNLPQNRKLVAMTMRPYRFPGSQNPEGAYEIFKEEMAKFITWLYDEGYMPVIVEHTLAVNTHENDGACIKDVAAKVDDEKYRVVSSAAYNCNDLKCIYSYCDYIVGTRFHSIIFAFGSNIPGIAIAYTGNKSQGIMHDIGLDDYVINISQVRVEVLIKKFESLVLNRDQIVKKINNYKRNAALLRNELIELCREDSK